MGTKNNFKVEVEKAKSEVDSHGLTKELKQNKVKTWKYYRCDLTFEDASHTLMHKDISRHSATQISKKINIILQGIKRQIAKAFGGNLEI